ncbi:hypothetical protein D3218_10670 [Aureimonas flava]|uniref:Peptidase metallopeptidase domain-containing protein n=1 Tax=Aureimonas flava TaxID=2320271 RepID=A0A3A1WLY0_9HYPH|nr:matrixin family metalloprotease [Aureimonas flava]RIY00861.1 hypothetical protein D3218_10670 [Aureimonas flava]
MVQVPYTGSKWGDSAASGTGGGTVTWSFNLDGARFYAFDGAISSTVFQTWVRQAFDTWEKLANIDFVEVPTASADIQIGLDAFDGRGGTLGEASWTYSGGLTIHAEIAFDSAEYWGPTSAGGTNFYAVAVHEIGHTIGLGHADDPSSIMYPYLGSLVDPAAADIAAIQALYGVAGQSIGGTEGADVLYGSTGADTVSAFGGDDLIYAYEGNDLVFGNQGNDTIHAGVGNDLVYGGKDDDQLFGNQGDDTITGNIGNDTVHGGQGNDLVHGGRDDDFVSGDRGNDTLHGGFGNDTLAGGSGADLFLFDAGHGNDIILDFNAAEGDRMNLGGQTYSISESSGSAVLGLSGGGTITLLGVTAAAFDAAAVA